MRGSASGEQTLLGQKRGRREEWKGGGSTEGGREEEGDGKEGQAEEAHGTMCRTIKSLAQPGDGILWQSTFSGMLKALHPMASAGGWGTCS